MLGLHGALLVMMTLISHDRLVVFKEIQSLLSIMYGVQLVFKSLFIEAALLQVECTLLTGSAEAECNLYC